MGCSTSKLEDEDAVRLCHDRKNFIRQAIEQRDRFADGHTAYIQSLMRVSLALRNYVDGDEYNFFFTSCKTSPSHPIRSFNPEIIMIPMKPFTPKQKQHEKSTCSSPNYMKAGGNPLISVEERHESPANKSKECCYIAWQNGADGYFAAEAPTTDADASFLSSPYERLRHPPASPQASQLDFFWNPFSSYGYSYGNSLDEVLLDGNTHGQRKIWEDEGVPALEGQADKNEKARMKKGGKINIKPTAGKQPADAYKQKENMDDMKEFWLQGWQRSTEVSETQNAAELLIDNDQGIVRDRNSSQETPGFTVYINRRPTSMGEVMKDIEAQFVRICNSASELSTFFEVSSTQPSSSSLQVSRMLNPAAMAPSTSSHMEESRAVPGSHKSTLDRLYEWEKKLYDEVKCGERARIEYEKKCMQLKIQDVNEDEAFVVDKTSSSLRDLQTRLRVSISSTAYISERIETLRDQELHPQVLELIQKLASMWRTMAECHRIQKHTIDEAKLLLFSPSVAAVSAGIPPPRPSRFAAALEAELRNWASCLATWIEAQRCYARALAGWIRRCAPPTLDAAASTPSRSTMGAPPAYGACVWWSRMVDSVSEAAAIDGVEMFAAGVASVAAGQRREGVAEVEEAVGGRAAELGPKVVCAGLAVAVGAVAELAVNSAEGYDELV
ncbi:protein ROLLING AND ERECT LEAF 2-like isoform X1 [Musa acuminata AAA Group]|uniref:protein ROLLING AND ERECT LEAF 2-like isoform X1 n=1 Tax=Musa acuminata AAA Group TaxID=214697 RepID=UPI0031E27046